MKSLAILFGCVGLMFLVSTASAVTFYLNSTTSDLTGGADWNKNLLTVTSVPSTVSATILRSSTRTQYAWTNTTTPNNTAWESGTFTVKVNVTGLGSTSYLWLNTQVDHVYANGTVIESSAASTEQQMTSTGIKTFSIASKSWTAGSSTDRLRVRYIMRNSRSNADYAFTISQGDANSYVSSSITLDKAGTVSNFSANQTSGTEPLQVGFTDLSLNTPTNWDWYWYANETKSSDDQNPKVSLPAGTYNVRLYTSNTYGNNWSNKSSYITVSSPPPSGNFTDFTVNTTTALTDYQVKLILSNATGHSHTGGFFYTNGTTRSDWADVRFTDTTNASLPYWKENRTDTATNSTWWIRVPSIEVGNTTQIRMFYGDSSRTVSTANGYTTFQVFDDFDETSFNLTTWNKTSSTPGEGTWVVSNSNLTMTPTGTLNDIATKSNSEFGENYSVMQRTLSQYYASFIYRSRAGWASGDNVYLAYAGFNDEAYGYEGRYRNMNPSNALSAMKGWSANTFYKLEGRRNLTEVDWTVNDANRVAFSTNYPSGRLMKAFFHLHFDNYLVVDWVAIRRFTSNEPFLTTPYEESGSTPPVASFTVDKTTIRFPDLITCTDTSTNSPTSWQWSWGDGTANSTTKNSTHQYTKRGTYQIYLTATNGAGSSQAGPTTVKVYGWENNYS